METLPSDESMRRPEFDKTEPGSLFGFAMYKQRWIRNRVHLSERPQAIDHLAEELEQHVTSVFESLPELSIIAQDVHYTKRIRQQNGTFVIDTAPLPLQGDAEVFGEHNFQATYRAFHRGVNDDLRVYVDVGDSPRHLMGGIYTPLLSVAVEGSTIALTETKIAARVGERREYIANQSKEYSVETKTLIALLDDLIDSQTAGRTMTLQACSAIIAQISRQKEVTPQVIDALMEVMTLQIELDEPNDIHTSAHREVITVQPIPAYKAKAGPTHFKRVVPELGLIGETANRGLGLFFLYNDAAVQVPVQYITSLYKSE